jgi:hypothetical protein
MKKFALVLILLTAISLILTPYALAGARKGKAGYAVRDDNAMKEIKAIKISMRSMEKDIQLLQASTNKGMTAIEQGKIEGRLTWAEGQIAKLWKWVVMMAILIALMLTYIVVALLSGGRRRSQANT